MIWILLTLSCNMHGTLLTIVLHSFMVSVFWTIPLAQSTWIYDSLASCNTLPVQLVVTVPGKVLYLRLVIYLVHVLDQTWDSVISHTVDCEGIWHPSILNMGYPLHLVHPPYHVPFQFMPMIYQMSEHNWHIGLGISTI